MVPDFAGDADCVTHHYACECRERRFKQLDDLASKFTIQAPNFREGASEVYVERTHWGDGPYPGEKAWAIRCFGRCWTRDAGWEFEPLPSSRDRAFLKRARFDRDEAIELASSLVEQGDAP